MDWTLEVVILPVSDIDRAIESMTFEDLGGGRTKLRIHSVYPTVEARDGMVASGMETGLTEGYARLDGLVAA